MRRPWNRELTGLLAVHNYEEFFQLLDQIKSAMIEDRVGASSALYRGTGGTERFREK